MVLKLILVLYDRVSQLPYSRLRLFIEILYAGEPKRHDALEKLLQHLRRGDYLFVDA